MLQKIKTSPFIFLVALIILPICKSSTLKVTEGEEAQLSFPYPCDSTEVTLRHGYRTPFYTSVNPEAKVLTQNQLLINQNDTAHSNCSLHLTINPVSRNDEGTYILTAYKNGQMLPEYPRIGPRVDYALGSASCVSSTEYIDQDWISLRCTAPVGTLPGQILCYQNGRKVPPLTAPTVKGGTLYQSMLVELRGIVFCCSSPADDIKDRCECTDCGWDPALNEALDEISEPCLVTTPIPSHDNTEKSKTSLPSSNLLYTEPPKTDQNHLWIWKHVDIVLLVLLFVVIGILLLVHFLSSRKCSRYSLLD